MTFHIVQGKNPPRYAVPVLLRKSAQGAAPPVWEERSGLRPTVRADVETPRIAETCAEIIRGAKERKCRSVAFLTGEDFDSDDISQIISAVRRCDGVNVTLSVSDGGKVPLPERIAQALACIVKRHAPRRLDAPAFSEERLGAPIPHSRTKEDHRLCAERLSADAAPDGIPIEGASTACSIDESAARDYDASDELDAMIARRGESFRRKLLSLIDERSMSDVEVYKRANIDRKLFSKIRCSDSYKPRKKTAVALAVALRLDMDELCDLLSRAELGLSPDSVFDIIIEYFVSHRIYDIYTINSALFRYGQPLLGA